MLFKFERLVNPEDPVTFYEGLDLAGILWIKEDDLHKKVYTVIAFGLWPVAMLHFLLKIMLEFDKNEVITTMEAVHWMALHMTLGGMSTDMLLRTKLFLKIHKTIKSGVYKYPEPLTKFQEEIIRNERDKIHFLAKLYFFLELMAFACTQLKAALFDDGEWALQFPGWFPFEVNSYTTYAVAVTFQVVTGYDLVICVLGISGAYTALLGHIKSELEVLTVSVRNLLREPSDFRTVKRRLKSIVEHHNAIISLNNLVSDYFYIPLFVMATMMIVTLCTVSYVLTDPKSDLAIAFPLFSVFVPEVSIVVLFCLIGQRVTNQCEILCEAVYEIEWYSQPPQVNKDLLMILRKTQKAFVITGGGLQRFNLAGLMEILQTSYSYFNMLVVLRKS